MYYNRRLVLLVVVAITHVFTTGATTPRVAIHSPHLRSNTIANARNNSQKSGTNGIYFSDSPLNDGEGSADGPDDDLDENASGKGEDDEDSAAKDIIDNKEGSGSQPTGNRPDSDDEDDGDLELGSGDESLFISSTERPIIRPETTRTPVTTPKESKESETFEPTKNDPIESDPIDNQLPDQRHAFETSTRFPSTRHPIITDDDNKEDNDVATMYMGPRSQMSPASFFARPGILAAVIGGAVVGLLCAILLVMFIVYRMRKKDEGSYALDEHKRSTAANPYARGASKELYA